MAKVSRSCRLFLDVDFLHALSALHSDRFMVNTVLFKTFYMLQHVFIN